MPDISLCSGEGCPMKDTCYRFVAKPGEWQSYFTAPPIKDGACDKYVEAWSKSQVRRLDSQTGRAGEGGK